MKINKQKPIEFINNCNCEVDISDLMRAILWFANGKPVARFKTIFIYGRYPAVSIYEQKIHIHRLLWMWLHNRKLDRDEYVHHLDGNKLNARTINLHLMSASEHQRKVNKGRKQTPEHITKRIDATTKTRYGHSIYENSELLERRQQTHEKENHHPHQEILPY